MSQVPRHGEQAVEWGHRPRRDHIIGAIDALRFGGNHRHITKTKLRRRSLQKVSAKPTRLDQRHRLPRKDGDHHAWKPGPAADVAPSFRSSASKASQLRPIDQMTFPQILDTVRRNEVLLSVFGRKKGSELINCSKCFT